MVKKLCLIKFLLQQIKLQNKLSNYKDYKY